MDKKIWVSVVILIIMFFGGAAIYKDKQNQNIDNTYTREDAIKDEVTRPKETIDTKYQYKDGEHIFVGTLLLPTPCDSFNAEVAQKDHETEIKITTQAPDEICAQQITERTFKVRFAGEKDDLIIASINGEIVNLNIFEIPDTEDINDIEVYIKG